MRQELQSKQIHGREQRQKMEKAIREEKLKQEVIDVTLPSKKNIV